MRFLWLILLAGCIYTPCGKVIDKHIRYTLTISSKDNKKDWEDVSKEVFENLKVGDQYPPTRLEENK